MSAEAAALTRSWPVGRFTCMLTVPRPSPGTALHAAIEWEPHAPRQLMPRELEQYRAGRNRALAELASELGLSAMVLEI